MELEGGGSQTGSLTIFFPPFSDSAVIHALINWGGGLWVRGQSIQSHLTLQGTRIRPEEGGALNVPESQALLILGPHWDS